MPHNTFDRISAYVRAIADELSLRDWEIKIAKTPLEDDSFFATTITVPGRCVATIKLAEGFAKETPKEITETLIHEVLHCSMRNLMGAFDDVKPFLSGDAYALLTGSANRSLELAIDQLAVSLAHHLPEFK